MNGRYADPIMTPTPTPAERPRAVLAGFWCWVVAAILTTVLGVLVLSGPPILTARIVGALLILVGLALAYLANRARQGDPRFARAAVALAMASVAFLTLLLFVIPRFVLIIAAIVILQIVGSVLSQRPTVQRWFEGQVAR